MYEINEGLKKERKNIHMYTHVYAEGKQKRDKRRWKEKKGKKIGRGGTTKGKIEVS